jgi:hypothetical protein
MSFDNTNRGVLFTVREKKSENAPDMTGTVEISIDTLQDLIKKSDNGLVKLSLAAWKKTSEGAGQFISISVKPWLSPEEFQAMRAGLSPRGATATPLTAEPPRKMGRPRKTVSFDD